MDRNARTTILSVLGIIAVIAVMAFAGVGIARRIGGFFGATSRFDGGQHSPEVVVTEHADWIMNWGDLTDFRTIHTSGGWIVEISSGDDYAVRVEANDRVGDDVEIDQRGETLYVNLRSGINAVINKPTLHITTPTLDRLECDGAATVLITGFDADSLALDIDGAANVRAESSSWDELSLSVDGASAIDFSQSSVVDAEIRMDGASSLRITMAGGELTGTLNGVGNVIYGGQVSAERVRIEGLGRVRTE